jgi:shikimate kinase
MGCGKTTHGKRLAKNLDYKFIDLDQWIENQAELTVAEIFAQQGEEAFREMETEAIKALSKEERVVISTGGGAPIHNNNMELLRESGQTIYLRLSPKALASRLTTAKTQRPLLAGKRQDELVPLIELMLSERIPVYESADIVIDGLDGVDERMERVVRLMEG